MIVEEWSCFLRCVSTDNCFNSLSWNFGVNDYFFATMDTSTFVLSVTQFLFDRIYSDTRENKIFHVSSMTGNSIWRITFFNIRRFFGPDIKSVCWLKLALHFGTIGSIWDLFCHIIWTIFCICFHRYVWLQGKFIFGIIRFIIHLKDQS